MSGSEWRARALKAEAEVERLRQERDEALAAGRLVVEAAEEQFDAGNRCITNLRRLLARAHRADAIEAGEEER